MLAVSPYCLARKFVFEENGKTPTALEIDHLQRVYVRFCLGENVPKTALDFHQLNDLRTQGSSVQFYFIGGFVFL